MCRRKTVSRGVDAEKGMSRIILNRRTEPSNQIQTTCLDWFLAEIEENLKGAVVILAAAL